jgi:UDP-N-acetylglucosamine 2-epimerase (non-hydrolysing)
MAVSLAAFYGQIRIGHVEAGLRTYDKGKPFPEEINRRITSALADLHFAPTDRARRSLLKENIPHSSIVVTGNTVIDALLWVRETIQHHPPALPAGIAGIEKETTTKRMLLVTMHRRESWGERLEQICLALRDLAEMHPDVFIVCPVHLNPNVRQPVHNLLGSIEGILLIDPLAYASFVWLMDRSHLILTDSGGMQEEAPSLGKPVLVMREVTERPEGITAGNARLTGTDRNEIVAHAHELLTNDESYRRMSMARNPYGDGHAAELIVESLLKA